MARSDLDDLRTRVRQHLHVLDVIADWRPRRGLWNGPRVLANSVPKAGTNLLIKALVLAGGLRRSRFALHSGMALRGQADGATLPVGVDRPVDVALAPVRRRLRMVAANSVISAHLPYSTQARDLLAELGYQMVVVVRDPRDVVRSLGPFVLARPEHPLHTTFSAMDDDERLMAAITGIDGRLDGIRQRFDRVVAWSTWPDATMVRFEDLVGPHGGGTEEDQVGALVGITGHLGRRLDPEAARHVAGELFGGTSTFHRGSIGVWREAFGPAHHAAMQAHAGDLLEQLGYEVGSSR